MVDRPPEDRVLIGAVLQGDGDAFRVLVLRHQRLVAGVAWRMGIRRDDLEDVVSEVFLKAYQSLARFRPERPFAAWLHRLAANHVIDRRRRERRAGAVTELTTDLADRGPDPAEEAEERERAAAVRAALEELAPRHREALCLVHVEGLPVVEAARLLGVPSGTIKTRLMRGREQLRRLLARRLRERRT